MRDHRADDARRRNPRRCECQNAPDTPNTYRGARHFARCQHSTLHETTSGRQMPRVRRIPGTRGVVVVLTEG